jgi:Icc-related predicted phosphoesterase
MPGDILEKVLTDTLQVYFTFDESAIEELLLDPYLIKKQRVEKIKDLEVLIYTNDHNPPHFHVKSIDKKIDAKFLIETGEFMSGEIDTKSKKVIKAFYNGPKGKIIMQMIWNKRSPK